MNRRVMIGLLLVTLVMTGLASVVGAQDRHEPRGNARGLVFDGLREHERGRCAGSYKIAISDVDPICTHGPDPAPAGIDVTEPRTVADLTSEGTASDAMGSAGLWCSGTGTDGPRVQAIYAVASDRPDRFASVAPLIAGWAAQMDSALNQSSAETGGDLHIRFVTTPDCTLDVAKVVVSPTGDDNISNMITEIRAQGFTATNRKYLIWADASTYCGIAQVAGTDSPSASNPANGGPHYARVDTGCWGRSDHLSELHELMHTLGAVQKSAPHATTGYHCTDESDAMCYPDSAGVTMTQVCPASHEWLLDCNHDDYFHTSPAPDSYLGTHWNVAMSVYLATGGTIVVPPPSPEPVPSPTASPTPTETSTPPPTETSTPPPPPGTTSPAPVNTSTTFGGSLSARRSPVKTFTLSVGYGDTTSSLTFSARGKNKTPPSLSLRILAADGTVLAEGAGPSVLRIATQLSVGVYTWEVSGKSDVTFSLQVTHVLP